MSTTDADKKEDDNFERAAEQLEGPLSSLVGVAFVSYVRRGERNGLMRACVCACTVRSAQYTVRAFVASLSHVYGKEMRR